MASSRMTMTFEEHQSELLEELRAMFQARLLVDVTMCVQDSRIPCHRAVLAAASPYFRAMFTSDLDESRQSEVWLRETDAEAVRLLIGFAYTGKLEITSATAQSLLSTASLLQMTSVQRACARFMETQLDEANCVGVQGFAAVHNCHELFLKAKEYIEKHFIAVARTEEFLDLPVERVIDIVASDELNVEREEFVYEAIMAWISRDLRGRRSKVGELMQHLRFPLVGLKYLTDIVYQNPLLMESEKGRHLLRNIAAFLESPEKVYSLSGVKDPFPLRSGMIQPEHCVLLVGGIDQNKPSAINCYNPQTREAFFMATFPESQDRARYYCVEDPAVIVTDENAIYAAGGNYIYHANYGESSPTDEDSVSFDDFEDEESVRKDVYLYDNDHNKWVSRAPMLFPKSNFTLAALDRKIYSFGGLTLHQHPTEIVESYDLDLDRWNYVGMMPTTLVDLSSVVLGGEIYLLGGRTGVGAHNVAIKFDPRKSEWTSLAGMPTPRFNFGACVLEGSREILVAGGQIYSHSTNTIRRDALRSCEVYNVEANQWRQGPELTQDMYNVGLMHINGRVYAVGTSEQQRSPFRIYRYTVVCRLDAARSRWEQLEADLCDLRSFAPVAAKLYTRKLSQVFRPEVDT
ncbi:kelch-like protein 20 [Elysia marginata]|uniref:Kelch-like protein 20 n=1 Tax=Elysia marginata TaxID=1093978 RepID=A0AAV4H9N8_9GAST|nr:kelch-like protein 20 [Elysia marginata]